MGNKINCKKSRNALFNQRYVRFHLTRKFKRFQSPKGSRGLSTVKTLTIFFSYKTRATFNFRKVWRINPSGLNTQLVPIYSACE